MPGDMLVLDPMSALCLEYLFFENLNVVTLRFTHHRRNCDKAGHGEAEVDISNRLAEKVGKVL
jgi:hypothetical protein